VDSKGSIVAFINQEEYTHERFVFPGGEVHVKFDPEDLKLLEDVPNISVLIKANLASSQDIMEMLLVTNALKETLSSRTVFSALIPYFPYARQDRLTSIGEPFSLRVMTSLVNSQAYDIVTVWDVHSDVAAALIGHVRNVSQTELISRFKFASYMNLKTSAVVSPDAGALKKIHGVASVLGMPIIKADKIRDIHTGKISGCEVHTGPLGDKSLLIADDICDGGRTFIELAIECRKYTEGDLFLYVTHGIFSNGLETLRGLFKNIFVANLFDQSLANDPLIVTFNR
jgi:ribose-phosphate pyrophosphokinase